MRNEGQVVRFRVDEESLMTLRTVHKAEIILGLCKAAIGNIYQYFASELADIGLIQKLYQSVGKVNYIGDGDVGAGGTVVDLR